MALTPDQLKDKMKKMMGTNTVSVPASDIEDVKKFGDQTTKKIKDIEKNINTTVSNITQTIVANQTILNNNLKKLNASFQSTLKLFNQSEATVNLLITKSNNRDYLINKLLKVSNKNTQNLQSDKHIQDTNNKTYACLKGATISSVAIGGVHKVVSGVVYAAEKVKKLFSVGWKGIKWLFSTGPILLQKMFKFIAVSPIKMVMKSVDNIFSAVFGPLWSGFKKITDTVIITPLKWMVSIGFTALTYIGKGITTIFGIGYEVVSTAASIMGLGLSYFTSFVTKLFVKTFTGGIFNLVSGIIIFSVIGGLVLDAIAATIAGSTILGDWIIKGADLLISVGNIVWGGIKTFFSWLDDKLGISTIAKSIVSTVGSALTSVLITVFGKDNVDLVFGWVSKITLWIGTNYSHVSGWIAEGVDWIKGIFKIIKEKPLGVLVVDFLDGLDASSLGGQGVVGTILASFKESIVPKLRGILGMERGTTYVRQVESLLSEQKNKLAEAYIQQYYLSLKQDGKTESEIRKSLVDSVIKNLDIADNMKQKYASEEFFKEMQLREQNTSLGKSGADQYGFSTFESIQQRQSIVKAIESQLIALKSGNVDPNYGRIQEYINQLGNQVNRIDFRTRKNDKINAPNIKNMVAKKSSLDKSLSHFKDVIKDLPKNIALNAIGVEDPYEVGLRSIGADKIAAGFEIAGQTTANTLGISYDNSGPGVIKQFSERSGKSGTYLYGAASEGARKDWESQFMSDKQEFANAHKVVIEGFVAKFINDYSHDIAEQITMFRDHKNKTDSNFEDIVRMNETNIRRVSADTISAHLKPTDAYNQLMHKLLLYENSPEFDNTDIGWTNRIKPYITALSQEDLTPEKIYGFMHHNAPYGIEKLPKQEFENGGVISSSIMKLDNESLVFVQNKIKTIIETEEPTKENHKSPLESIIVTQENIENTMSYEIYTLGKLSRGILGV